MIPHPVLVKDVRGKEDLFTMDVNGFQFMKHKSAVKPEDLSKDDERLRAIYAKECEEIFKKAYAQSHPPFQISLEALLAGLRLTPLLGVEHLA